MKYLKRLFRESEKNSEKGKDTQKMGGLEGQMNTINGES